jgi:amino acid permease
MEGEFNVATAVASIINSMLGSGINFMPASFSNSGTLSALFFLFCIACLTTYSIYVLFRCSSKYSGELSYANLGKNHSKYLKITVDLVIVCASFFTALGFQKYINTLTFFYIKEYFPNKSAEFDASLKSLILVYSTIPLTALAMIRNFGNLKILSYMGVFCVTSLIVVLGFFNLWIPDYINDQTRLVDKTTDFSFGLSYFIIAMSVQVNIPQVYKEIKDKSKMNLLKIAVFASFFGFAVYGLAGYLGYRLVGDYIGNNDIIMQFLNKKSHINQYLTSIGSNLGYLLKFQGFCAILILLVGFPMQLGPATRYFKQLIKTKYPNSIKFHGLIVLVLMLVLTTINLIPNVSLELVYGLLGPSAVGFISFLFPFIFYILNKRDSLDSKLVKMLKLIPSYLICCFSLIYCCYGCTMAVINNSNCDNGMKNSTTLNTNMTTH